MVLSSSHRLASHWLVAGFLLAIVIANLAVARWGQVALVFTAWVLIPFDMLTRDLLHERWDGSRVWAKMLALTVAGGLVTAIVNPSASRVATASVLALSASMLCNTAGFALLHDRGRLVRMNGSNAAAAVADSIVFPLVAFGGLDYALSAAQAGAKFCGGLLWSVFVVQLLARWQGGRDGEG